MVLLGRTGNILFQYALGRALAIKHRVPLLLDASWYNANGWREVSHFLNLPIAADVVRDPTLFSRALLKITGRHRWSYAKFPFLTEKSGDHTFDPRFLNAPTDCALFGYFQSWRYFSEIEHELRGELSQLLEMEDMHIPKSLLSPHSVAVHVRRGDFLNHPDFQVCDHAYYRQAMDEMRTHVGNPKFLIFSDDPTWCQNTFNADDVDIIDSGKAAATPLHDLHLMSLASHHIIANSTYSWWAAWIGKKTGQHVILPPRWFNGSIIAPMCDKNAW